MRRRRNMLFAAAMLPLLAVGLTSCQGRQWQGFPATTDASTIWPPPPETPRVAFVMELRKHKDLFDESGFWRTMGRWFLGPKDSSIGRPYALGLHPDGGLLVTDPGRETVHFYCWGRRRYTALGERIEGGLPSPVGVAALPDGRILVSDSKRGEILVFSRDGKPLGLFGEKGLVTRPAGIAVDAAAGEVFVADVMGHRVAVLDTSGRLKRWIGKRGAGPGEFNFPTHLALGPDGRLSVTDSMNFRVQTLRPDGTFEMSVGSLGDAPGQFAKPKGVAVDERGNLIAVEGIHDALQFFSPDGRLLLSLGSPGHEPGQFWLPAGLRLDGAKGLLFVADSYNSRVQVFRLLKEATP